MGNPKECDKGSEWVFYSVLCCPRLWLKLYSHHIDSISSVRECVSRYTVLTALTRTYNFCSLLSGLLTMDIVISNWQIVGIMINSCIDIAKVACHDHEWMCLSTTWMRTKWIELISDTTILKMCMNQW